MSQVKDAIYVSELFPQAKYRQLMAGREDVSRYVKEAVKLSWDWVQRQYKEWRPEPGVNYPSFQNSATAWGASSAAVGIPIVLPPATLLLEKSIVMPSCIPLLGAAYSDEFGHPFRSISDSHSDSVRTLFGAERRCVWIVRGESRSSQGRPGDILGL